MKLKSIVAVAALAGVALFGAACGTKDKPADGSSSSSNNAAEQKGDPKEELQAAFKKSAEAKSVTIEGTADKLTVNMSIDYAAKTAVLKLKGKIDGEDQDMEIRIFGTEAYIQLNTGDMAELLKGKWVKSDAKDFGDVFDEKTFDSAEIIKDTTKVERLAAGQFKVSDAGSGASGLFSKLKGETASTDKSDAVVTVTVGADGRIAAIDAKSGKASETYSMKVTGYDTPVSADKPAEKDIVDPSKMSA